MSSYIERSELKVDQLLVSFIEDEVLPGLPIEAADFWASFSSIVSDLSPVNKSLLTKRDDIQAQLDQWNSDNRDHFDASAYKQFLQQIGYLVEEGDDFAITTENVDTEIAQQAGAQLVVPTSNARFALNATNARWGSLYDALYGTDAISEEGGAEKGGAYNPVRGNKVIAFGRALLDQHFALETGSHADATAYLIEENTLRVNFEDGSMSFLANIDQCTGYTGDVAAPTAVLLKNNGLHVVIEIDPESPIGKTDQAGVKDLTLEAAVTTIQDFEDSVAAVDAEDKVGVYRNWLGLMKGNLEDTFEKGGKMMTRSLADDRDFTAFDGSIVTLHGRSLLFCRNVGHLMSNPAILDANSDEIQEGIMDAMVSVLIAMHDLNRTGERCNSRTGSVYIVKPKMHGPEAVSYTHLTLPTIYSV